MNEPAYWGREGAEALGSSSIRKYCIALEKFGHVFTKGLNNSRAFLEQDITLLRWMKDLIHTKGVTTNDAAEVVLSTVKEEPRTEVVRGEQPLVIEELNSIRTAFEQQKEFNIQLISELKLLREDSNRKFEQQQKYIESLKQQLYKEREYQEQRDQQLTTIAKDILDTKKMVATSKEQGFLSRLFKR
ncbi:hypothetical protein [Priestia filamentosa]|uniref:hypothetical protein n=1 Tax=Priestia filamentosa TaxID=1402861 RepID=UPI000A08236B|nr:hypothetical protein [Priestia filamentosa]OXS64677.1 hypothetical protein B1B01_25145 [Priestia filamentosa]SMF75120.1 hypothetical protein SAMN06296056_11724 [Priestia filamentosa]